jgi:hypothetical protein
MPSRWLDSSERCSEMGSGGQRTGQVGWNEGTAGYQMPLEGKRAWSKLICDRNGNEAVAFRRVASLYYETPLSCAGSGTRLRAGRAHWQGEEGEGMTYKPPSKGYDPPTEYRPPAHEQPSTLPKDGRGQAINEDRRQPKAREADFEAKHGRKMTKKDRKRLRRDR